MGLLDNSLMGHGQQFPPELQGLQSQLHHLGSHGLVNWMLERDNYEKQNQMVGNISVANQIVENHQTSYHQLVASWSWLRPSQVVPTRFETHV